MAACQTSVAVPQTSSSAVAPAISGCQGAPLRRCSKITLPEISRAAPVKAAITQRKLSLSTNPTRKAAQNSSSQRVWPECTQNHRPASASTRISVAIIVGPQSMRAWLINTGSVASSASASSAHAVPRSRRRKPQIAASDAAPIRIDGRRTVQTSTPKAANSGACSQAFTAPT